MAAPCALALSKLVYPEKKELKKKTMDVPKMEARWASQNKNKNYHANDVS